MIKRICDLCHIEKPTSEYKKDYIGYNIINGEKVGKPCTHKRCRVCENRIKRHDYKEKTRKNRVARELKGDLMAIEPALETKLIEENKMLREELTEYKRQVEILIPMVHKDARKMYYEMNPHMDVLRDKNAGKEFTVFNLGLEEKVGEFTNVAYIAEELSLPAHKIQACLKGTVNQVNGYTFFYNEDLK